MRSAASRRLAPLRSLSPVFGGRERSRRAGRCRVRKGLVGQKSTSELTFESLDRDRGHSLPAAPPDGEFPLPEWYRRVYRTPLKDLSLEDIGRACRQQIYPEYVVPFAVQYLEEDLLAGEMYDGELLSSLAAIQRSFWEAEPDVRDRLRRILAAAVTAVDSEAYTYVTQLSQRLQDEG